MTGCTPIAFLNPSAGISDALPPASVQRLRRLKDRYDPRGLIRGNVPLPA